MSAPGHTDPRHVLVAGAGPAGASFAYLLASRGVPVTLIERRSDFAREFRGEVLMPGGLDVLRQIGLGDRLEDLPQVAIERIEVHSGGKRVFAFDLRASLPGAEGFRIVSQPALLRMLVAEAGRHDAFRFLPGALVRDIVLGARGGGVGVSVRVGGERREVRGGFLVGADGRNSVVRRRVGLHEERSPQAFDVVWCKVPLPDFLRDRGVVRFYIGRSQLAVAFPSYDGRLQVGWLIEKGSYGALVGRGIERAVDRLSARTSPELRAHLLAHLDEMSHPFLLDVVSDRLVRWTRPGVLLIGDAAHPMSPIGAQGINIALRDALVAASRLVPTLAAGGGPAELNAAALAVQRERAPEVRSIQALQAVPPLLLLGTSRLARGAQRALPWLLGSGLATPFYRWGVRRLAAGTERVTLEI